MVGIDMDRSVAAFVERERECVCEGRRGSSVREGFLEGKE